MHHVDQSDAGRVRVGRGESTDFAVLAGHVVHEVEDIVAERESFTVVRKRGDAAEIASEADPRSRRHDVRSVRLVAEAAAVRIVVRHDNDDRWWWTLLGEDGRSLAVSSSHVSRSDCARAIAELKVEGPFARVDYEDVVVTPRVAAHGRSPA